MLKVNGADKQNWCVQNSRDIMAVNMEFINALNNLANKLNRDIILTESDRGK
jgi:hypothetical protein